MNDGAPPDPMVSVVMPCLNEEEAIGACIEKIQRTFAEAGLPGEIVVSDNGSTDRSVAIAEEHGRPGGASAAARLRERLPQGLRKRPGPLPGDG